MSPDALNVLGVSLGHFELLDCIGVGGMGRVFRARDTNLDRMVAVKVLAPDVGQDPEICRRFEQEGKAAARLDDRHFARVYYCGKDKGLQYIAMEYVEGDNLRTLIERQGRLDFEMVVNIGIQIARGLAHAARSGVVHRDIKPSNIIITPTGTAKLVDMGLARNFLQQSSPASEITHAGATLGTFDYISPEQARNARDADVRSDIYSLGCTLYHALAGRPPYPDGSALQKLLQHQNDAVPDLRRWAPDSPDLVAAIVHKMMAKNPRDRYQTPGELIADLLVASNELNIPLPEESDFVADLGTGQTFWERQLVWFVPTVVFCLAIWVYSFFEKEQDLTFPEPPIAREAAVAPAVEKSEPQANAANPPAAAPTPVPLTAPAEEKRIRPGELTYSDFADAPAGSTIHLEAGRHELPSTDLQQIVLDRHLEIVGPEKGIAVIALNDEGRGDESNFFMFQIDDAWITFRRIRFEMTCDRGGGKIISVQAGRLQLQECAFFFRGRTQSDSAMIDIFGDRDTEVTADRCYFDGGGNGIRVEGSSNFVRLDQCGFNGSLHPFALNSDAGNRFDLTHVSARLNGVSVVRANRWGPDTRFVVSESVFSQSGDRPQPLVSVADQNGDSAGIWVGLHRNVYHGFDLSTSFADPPTQDLAASSPYFRAATDSFKDENPCRLFRLAEPFRYVDATGRPYGVTDGPWGRIYDDKELARARDASKAIGKQASPTPASQADELPFVLIEDDRRRSVRYLSTACIEAADGAVIEVTTDGPIRESRQIEISGKRLTIRAAKGTNPLLAWNGANGDSGVTSLFRIKNNGKLSIEGVHFRARPSSRIPAGGCLFECQFGSTVDLSKSVVEIVPASNDVAGELPVFRIRADGSLETRAQMPNMVDKPASTVFGVHMTSIRSSYPLLDAHPLALWSLSVNSSFVATESAMVGVRGPSVMLPETSPNRLDIQYSTCATKDSVIVVSIEGSAAEAPRQTELLIGQSVFIGNGLAFARTNGSFESARHDNSFNWQAPEGAANFVVGFRRPQQATSSVMPMSPGPFGPGPSDWLDPEFASFVFSDKDPAEFWDEPIRSIEVPDEAMKKQLGIDSVAGEDAPGVNPLWLPEFIIAQSP